jgi:hypothetical protein
MSPAISPNSPAIVRASKKRVQDTGEMLQPEVEINEYNGLLTKSMTCWLQICCRIFWTICCAQPWIVLLLPGVCPLSRPDLQAAPG